MNNTNRWMKIAVAAVLAALMAGTAAEVLLTAMQIAHGAAPVWLFAAAAAALCAMAAWSAPLAIAAALTAAIAAGVGVGMNPGVLGGAKQLLMNVARPTGELPADAAGAGVLLAAAAAAVFSGMLFPLIHKPGGTPFALLLEYTVIIGSYALREDMSFAPAIPGLIASLAAFSLSGGVQKDSGAWRAIIPAGVVVAVALLLTPVERVTWEPLENAANRVRAAFEDYFHFTQERIPFTISTEGYNHAAEVDGNVISALGGPAVPDTDPVMKVSSDADILLRGSIRRTYTGSAWVDNDAKARYLYMDFTRRQVRGRVFGMNGNEAFAPVRAQVEMLDTGISTLFVPARLGEFDMTLETAVYYNSIGEIFLARGVMPGDAYSLKGYSVTDEDALRSAVQAAAQREDREYARIQSECMQLPTGIEGGVYALTIELTEGCADNLDKALAIQSWLRNNCVYTLTPDYPDVKRDFVSEFVLEDRRGYCSYFASAMTVMCRIAGVPARYVEGYSVKAGEDRIVTGENAHAWTEVYFEGLGWIPFDPANGAGGGDDGRSGENDHDAMEDVAPTAEPESGDPDETPAPQDEPTPPPEHDAADEPTPSPEPQLPSPSPETENEDLSETLPENTPEPPDYEPTVSPPESRKGAWLWILPCLLLILLLVAAAALIRRRLRKTDPIRMSGAARTAQEAALILYRAMLTMLAQMGHAPASGETPAAFAKRVCGQIDNPAFEEFAAALAMNVYARADLDRSAVELGRHAYAVFEQNMKKREKLRCTLRRLAKGIGDFENIP